MKAVTINPANLTIFAQTLKLFLKRKIRGSAKLQLQPFKARPYKPKNGQQFDIHMNGKVIIFSAPSGSGKSTVVHYLLGKHPEFEFSISATSRMPRGKEKDGVDYYFIDADKFKSLIAEDAFVEYEEVYHDRFYGTLKSEVQRIWDKGHVIVFDVDVKGAYSLKRYFGDDALSILILPPSQEELEKRLRGRGTDSEEAIRERLGKAAEELEFAKGKADKELVNDKLEDTFRNADIIVDEFLSK